MYRSKAQTVIIGMDKCSVKNCSQMYIGMHKCLVKKSFSDVSHTIGTTATNKSYIVTRVREEGTQEQTKEGKMGPF